MFCFQIKADIGSIIPGTSQTPKWYQWQTHRSGWDSEHQTRIRSKIELRVSFYFYIFVTPSTNQFYEIEHGYKIKQGDIIRFGRVRFHVRRISSDDEYSSINESEINSDISSAITEKQSSEEREVIEEDNAQLENQENSREVTKQNVPSLHTSPRKFTNVAIAQDYSHVEVIDDLRRSFDSSLMFESQNELRLNQALDKRESFSQIKIKRKSISFL